MAKRGYRGKHPHNDMKISKTVSPTKYNSKLKSEYDKLPAKQKYSYIRPNYFSPQAEAIISGTVNFAANSAITMSARNGTELRMSGSTVEALTGTGTGLNCAFKANGNSLQNANSIASVVNNNLAGLITASVESVARGTATTNDAIVKLVMVEPGPDGNTTISFAGGAKATPLGVTINGTAANASSSAFTGG